MDFIFDIDGTIADNSHRLHHITTDGQPKDWAAFLKPMTVANDRPIPHMWALMNSLMQAGNRVILITSRPRSLRVTTIGWLTEQDCPVRGSAANLWLSGTAIRLYMRHDGDRRPSHDVKREILRRVRMEGFTPVMAFDDRASDAEMYRYNGVPCALMSEGNFDGEAR